jgi:hypothetical protein
VTDPSHFAEIRDLPEANDEELALMSKIVDKMTMDLDPVYSMIAAWNGSRP